MPGSILTALHIATPHYYYFPHFIDEKTRTERSSMPKLAQPASGRAQGQSWAVPARGWVWNHLSITSHSLRNPGHSLIHLTRMSKSCCDAGPGLREERAVFFFFFFPAQAFPTFSCQPKTPCHSPGTINTLHRMVTFLMHCPWEVREAMTEQMQKLFQNRDKVLKP